MRVQDLTPEHIQAAFWTCFHSESGRIVFAMLEEMAFNNETTFTPGDPHGTAFNEGRRSLLLDIKRNMEDLTYDHDAPGQPDDAPLDDPGSLPESGPGPERGGGLTRRAVRALADAFSFRHADPEPGSGSGS